MKALVHDAAGMTRADIGTLDAFTLRAAARVIRAFLVNLQGSVSRWRPWMRYAIGAVIAILDLLISDQGDEL